MQNTEKKELLLDLEEIARISQIKEKFLLELIRETEDLYDVLALRMEELDESMERIKEANFLLEEKVRERTKKLTQANRKLRELNKLKSQFLANISHELRTPLNAIMGFTSLLREGIYGEVIPKQKRILERIHTNAEHLLRLINDLLDLSRIEAGKMSLEVEEVNLEKLVQGALSLIEPQLKKKKLKFTLSIEPDLPLMRADPAKVKQILFNLLENSVKFTPEGEIFLGVKKTKKEGKEFVKITVKDTGIGIAQKELKNIFQEFHQVDGSSTRRFGGTGLGLSIVKKLTKLMGGNIKVKSEIGKGSTFKVYLPVKVEK